MSTITTIQLRVVEAASRDVGRGLVRIDPADMARLGARTGDVVLVRGKKSAVGKLMPAQRTERGQVCVHLDGLLRESAGCSLNESVELQTVDATTAEHITLRPRKIRPIERDLEYIASLIDGVPVITGSSLRATLFGNESIDFDVVATTPTGPVIIGQPPC